MRGVWPAAQLRRGKPPARAQWGLPHCIRDDRRQVRGRYRDVVPRWVGHPMSGAFRAPPVVAVSEAMGPLWDATEAFGSCAPPQRRACRFLSALWRPTLSDEALHLIAQARPL